MPKLIHLGLNHVKVNCARVKCNLKLNRYKVHLVTFSEKYSLWLETLAYSTISVRVVNNFLDHFWLENFFMTVLFYSKINSTNWSYYYSSGFFLSLVDKIASFFPLKLVFHDHKSLSLIYKYNIKKYQINFI